MKTKKPNLTADEFIRGAREAGADSLNIANDLETHQVFKKIYEAISGPIVETDLPDTLELMDWYSGPLTKKRLAELRYKLAKTRGLLTSFINLEAGYERPATEEILQILKETKDP